MVSVQLVVAVMVISPRLATGSSPDWNCAWSSISWRSNRSRQSTGPTCPCRGGRPRRSGWVFSTSAPARDSQTGSCDRRRQVRAGGDDQRAGVVRRLRRAGAHHADAQGPGGAVDRVEVGVVAGAVQLDAGSGGRRRRRTPATCSRATTNRSSAPRSAADRPPVFSGRAAPAAGRRSRWRSAGWRPGRARSRPAKPSPRRSRCSRHGPDDADACRPQ